MNVPVVTYDEAIKEFGRPAELARALGITRASVCGWRASGRLPPLRALQFLELRRARRALADESAFSLIG